MHALHGFRYQLLQSLAAWLNLRPDEALWLEVSEDYAVLSAAGDNAVQVKASRAASGPTRYSLQSADVRAALSRFWSRASASPGARLTFVANGGVAIERDYRFPGGVGGLAYWGSSARGADTAPLRAALSALFKDELLGEWLRGSPSDEELREKLLRRVAWALDAADVNELNAQLHDQVGAVYIKRGLPVSAVRTGLRALSDHIFEVACQTDAAARRLTVLDLYGAIEETVVALNLAKQMGAAERDASDDSQSVLVGEVGSESAALTRRDEIIATIDASVGAEPIVWLHGGHGAGKSTLARLLARHYGGRWLTLDLRLAQFDPGGALAAWRELLRTIAADGLPDGVVLDDFDDAAVGALSGRLSTLSQQLAERGARVIVTAPQPASAGRLAVLGASARANVAAPYFSDTEIKDMVGRAPAPKSTYIDAWALFIRLASGGGHPLLVASKVASLRARDWPEGALAEDVGKTSEAIQVTREEARRALLRDLSALDQARSLDAGALLRRIGAVFDCADAGLVSVLAKLKPAIGTATDALAVLRGSWLELLPKGEMRISPVIADISTDASAEDLQLWRRAAAEYWLRGRVLNERTLPLCFWNAFLGQHDWVLMKICETLQFQERIALRGAVALLAPLTALHTDASVYPTNPIVGVNLRLLQFQVADACESDRDATKIVRRLLVELDEIENEDVQVMMNSISASTVLMAQSVHVAPEDRLVLALRLRQSTSRVIELSGAEMKGTTNDIVQRFGIDTDIAGFLFASTISKVRNSDDFLATVKALDALSEEDRRGFLNVSAAIFDGLSVFVNSGWSRDQLEDRDMAHALGVYELAAAIAERWGIADLTAELAVAQSVILDEGLKDLDRAVAIVDAATSSFGTMSALVRQKAKVLGHYGRDEQAAELIVGIEDTVGGSSKLERGLALRDGATSAARCGRFDIAVRLYGKAVNVIDDNGGQEALAAGLRVDLAMALWDSGDRGSSLMRLADAFDILARLDEAASRQNQRAHQFARGAAGLFLHDTEHYPRTPRPNIAYGGASTLSLSSEALHNGDLKPLADNWRILALVEAESGIDAGIESRSRTVQTEPSITSIERMIGLARYSHVLIKGNLDETLASGIRAASGMPIAVAAAAGNGNMTRFDIDALSAKSLPEMLSDPQSRDFVIGLAVDVLVARRLQGQWAADVLDELCRAWSRVAGDGLLVDTVLKAATGRYAVGPSVPFNVHVALAVAQNDDEIAADPMYRFRRDMMFVGHVSQSMARRALEPLLVSVLQRGWTDVLISQRFRLLSPNQNCQAIEQALAEMPSDGLRAAARLIIAAAPSVGGTLTGTWQTMLGLLAAKSGL